MYPSMLSRGPDIETEPYYCLPVSTQSSVPWSQPTSPTPASRGFTGLLSPTHNTSHRLTYPKKNDEGKFETQCCFVTCIMMLIGIPFPLHHSKCMAVKSPWCRADLQCTVQQQKNRDRQMKCDDLNVSSMMPEIKWWVFRANCQLMWVSDFFIT